MKTDYLVIGAGAVSLAFVDTMLAESQSTFVIVDRHHMPGGHWNDAYPFVRLHQPSATYGVASRELGKGRIDSTGSNKGFYELATGQEVLAYFEQLMRERFLPSGRVRYFPMCDHEGDGRFRSLLGGAAYEVDVAKKIVDGAYFKTSAPSTHQRKFAVDASLACIAPNDLPRVAPGYRRFAILGAGKTAMDAGVWLLDNGAGPETIDWVMPRDSWLLNRATTQHSPFFFDTAVGGVAAQMEACAAASTVDDLFERMEATGVMLRIDPARTPGMLHYATISQGEVDQLRRIRKIIREGRVHRIERDRIEMENGAKVATTPETLYIDCTASAIAFGSKAQPVFDGDRITIQVLFSPLVTLSASITAYVEAHYDDEAEKNRLCAPNILADTPAQWMQSFARNLERQHEWSQDPALNDWIAANRLSPFGRNVDRSILENPEKVAVLQRIETAVKPALANLQKLIGEAA